MFGNKGKILLPLVLLSTTAASAFAGTENRSGADCVRWTGGDIRYTSDGAVYNNSNTTTAYVLCSVPHTDFDGFLHTGAIEGGWYDTVDLNNSSNTYCRFRSSSLSPTGSINRYYGASGSSTGFGTHRQSINLGSVGEDSRSAYVLYCSIPARTNNGISKIHAYRVSQ